MALRPPGLQSPSLRRFSVTVDDAAYQVCFHLRTYHRWQHRPSEHPLRLAVELLVTPDPLPPTPPTSSSQLALFDLLSTHIADAAAPPTEGRFFHANLGGPRRAVVDQLVASGALRVERVFPSGQAKEECALLELLLRDDPAAPELLRTNSCAYCGCVRKALSWCGVCKNVFYCDRECQRQDFKWHKVLCKSLAAAKHKPGQ